MGTVVPHPVRLARERLGLSQEELARRAGISTWTVQRTETWKTRPRPLIQRALAEVLALPVEELFPPLQEAS
ncbi:MAG TPA: helix-turn-helix transcriptional regulator [Actinomycetota bacterium]|nr:helix-turn-helix transcriptional regulator [Actinomycetota bacterium]